MAEHPTTRTPQSIALFVLLMGLWLLWSGHFTPLLIAFGGASCLLVVLLCRRMGVVDRESLPLHLMVGLVRYLPWLGWQATKANVRLAWRILTWHRRGEARPQWFKVRASARSDFARAAFANSITLTPGTVTVDAEADVLTVHSLTPRLAAELRGGEMDRAVRRMEGGT